MLILENLPPRGNCSPSLPPIKRGSGPHEQRRTPGTHVTRARAAKPHNRRRFNPPPPPHPTRRVVRADRVHAVRIVYTRARAYNTFPPRARRPITRPVPDGQPDG
jgi:hypothetical protein